VAITFAGVPLLLEDPGRQVQEWMERHLPLSDARLWGGRPVALNDARCRPRGLYPGNDDPVETESGAIVPHVRSGGVLHRVGLGTYNWPDPPPPQINTLYWPTGATRWGYGLFLADSDRLEEIFEAVGSDGAGTLKFEQERLSPAVSGEQVTIERKMYLLPPRPVSHRGTGDVAAGRLWLLPMVDLRYWWQCRPMGDYQLATGDTWESLLGLIEAAIGKPIACSSISGAFFYPDPTECTRKFENAAVLLDAVAASIGRRVVFGPLSEDDDPETVTLQSPEEGYAAFQANFEDDWRLLAGGSTVAPRRNLVPAGVSVVYPRWRDNLPQDTGDIWTVSRNTSREAVADAKQVFFNTAQADFPLGATVPRNAGALESLASAIADAYWNWRLDVYDASYCGLKPWNITGYDDYVAWHFGRQHAKPSADDDTEVLPGWGDYACYTRIAGLPPAVGVEELLNQVPGPEPEPSSSPSSSSPSSSSPSSSSPSSSSPSSSSPSSSSPSESPPPACDLPASWSSATATYSGWAITWARRGRGWCSRMGGCAARKRCRRRSCTSAATSRPRRARRQAARAVETEAMATMATMTAACPAETARKRTLCLT
jgi:hypothetical protein